MTPQRQRVVTVLSHGIPDVPPMGEFHLDDRLVAEALGRLPADLRWEDRRSFVEELGFDVIVGYPELPSGKPMLGVNMAKGLHALEDGHPDPVRRFGLPAPEELDWTPVRRWVDSSPLFVFGMLPGTFSELAYLWGFEDFLMATVLAPEEVRSAVEGMVDYALRLAEAYRANGVEACLIGDDFAWNAGLFVDPDSWRSLFLPALRREAEALKEAGLSVLLHNDGAIGDILEDLAALPIDGLHSLHPSAGMDLLAVKRRYAGRFVLWGNFDWHEVVQAADDQQLRAIVGKILADGAGGGGFIFGSASGEVGDDVPSGLLRRIYALAEAERWRHRRQDEP